MVGRLVQLPAQAFSNVPGPQCLGAHITVVDRRHDQSRTTNLCASRAAHSTFRQVNIDGGLPARGQFAIDSLKQLFVGEVMVVAHSPTPVRYWSNASLHVSATWQPIRARC